MGSNNGQVKILGVRIKEGHGGSIDSWAERGLWGHFCNFKITAAMSQ